MDNRRIFVFITLLAIPLIIFVCLLMVGVDCGNKSDTSDGLGYISELESQDAQYLEHSIAAGNAATTAPNRPTEEATEPSTEDVTDSTTQAPTEENTEGTTDGDVNEEPTTSEPVTQEPTTPAPAPGGDVIVVSGQSVIPYTIDKAMVADTMAQIDAGTLTYKSLYANSLFVGDSITSGFDVYSIVNSSNVIAVVGANMNTHLTENLATIVQYNPEYLFVHYGLNEMNPSEAGANAFVAKYKENLTYLKQNLPYTKIIVLALSPVGNAAIEKQNRFTWIPTYNDKVRAMCQEIGVGFHQNDAFFNERMHLYGKDGIHYQPELYRQWIRLITEEMGIY